MNYIENLTIQDIYKKDNKKVDTNSYYNAIQNYFTILIIILVVQRYKVNFKIQLELQKKRKILI